MIVTRTYDDIQRRSEQVNRQAEAKGRHLAELRRSCRRAPGLRGLVGGCVHAVGR
jgi:hypothetical protein